MCFKFWRTKKLPSERHKQTTSTPAEERDNDDISMERLRRKIEAINKVREAARLRRNEHETENEEQIEHIPPKVSFYLDPNPEEYDLDFFLSSPVFQIVVDSDDDDDDEDVESDEEVDASNNDKKRCHLS
nr:expressed protein [Hymenolepis microstoma]CUU97501.1 hypothetical transcript [Hymenolepis microstoma]